MKTEKKKIGKVIFLAVVAVLLIAYIGVAIYFQKHYLFHTTVNGVEASGATVDEVKDKIRKQIKEYTLQLEEKEDKTESFDGEQIGLEPVFDNSLDKLLEGQNGFLWITSVFKKDDLHSETAVAYKEDMLKRTVEALHCVQDQVQPQDAYISEYQAESGYSIVPEVDGSAIRMDEFYKVLDDAIINLKDGLSLIEKDCYEQPQIRKDNEVLNTQLAALNTYAKTSVTYTFGDRTEQLNGDTIHQWLSIGEDGNVNIDTAAVAEYVSGLASAHNTVFHNKELKTTYGPTVTITEGDYGWWIDKDAEQSQLIENIQAGDTVEREPVYKQRANSFGEHDYGDTYVEINLTAQHLYYYKGGALVVDSDFVSGCVAKGTQTPTGAYGVTYKEKDATLKGADYATPVSYWMPFCNGVGMHDANWRKQFGGDIYQNRGSHGCVNLPVGVAEKIFNNIEANVPVLVYQLPGTESKSIKYRKAGDAVTEAIAAIKDVSLESEGAIQSARSQYNALEAEARDYVSNYDTLVAAEQRLAELKAQQQPAPEAPAPEAPADGQ